MSEATRNLALGHAIAHHTGKAGSTPDAIVATATAFDNFISGSGDAPAKTAPKAATPAAKPAAKPTPAAKPAAKPAPKKPVAPPEDEAEEETAEEPAEETAEGDGPTKEDVGNSIASLINANLAKECGALLKEFGAKSLSNIPVESYADFIAKAEELLMNA